MTRIGAHQHLIRSAVLVAFYVFVNNLFARQSCTQPASPPALSWQPAHQCACISEGGVALVGALVVLVEVVPAVVEVEVVEYAAVVAAEGAGN